MRQYRVWTSHALASASYGFHDALQRTGGVATCGRRLMACDARTDGIYCRQQRRACVRVDLRCQLRRLQTQKDVGLLVIASHRISPVDADVPSSSVLPHQRDPAAASAIGRLRRASRDCRLSDKITPRSSGDSDPTGGSSVDCAILQDDKRRADWRGLRRRSCCPTVRSGTVAYWNLYVL
jgi:hypothetical protein